jgi:hypothetical protein
VVEEVLLDMLDMCMQEEGRAEVVVDNGQIMVETAVTTRVI